MKKSLIVYGATVFAIIASPSLAAAEGTGKVTTSPPSQSQSATTMSTADSRLAQQVRETLSRDSTLSSSAKNLKVSSNNGSVFVSGSVASEQERAKVESLASQAAGGDSKVTIDVAVE